MVIVPAAEAVQVHQVLSVLEVRPCQAAALVVTPARQVAQERAAPMVPVVAAVQTAAVPREAARAAAAAAEQVRAEPEQHQAYRQTESQEAWVLDTVRVAEAVLEVRLQAVQEAQGDLEHLGLLRLVG